MLKSHCYKEKRGLLKGKHFNCVYKGHFNVFESRLLNNAWYPSKNKAAKYPLIDKNLDARWKRRLSTMGHCDSFLPERGGWGAQHRALGLCIRFVVTFSSQQKIGLQGIWGRVAKQGDGWLRSSTLWDETQLSPFLSGHCCSYQCWIQVHSRRSEVLFGQPEADLVPRTVFGIYWKNKGTRGTLVIIGSLLFGGGNQGTERLTGMPKGTQHVSRRARI